MPSPAVLYPLSLKYSGRLVQLACFGLVVKGQAPFCKTSVVSGRRPVSSEALDTCAATRSCQRHARSEHTLGATCFRHASQRGPRHSKVPEINAPHTSPPAPRRSKRPPTTWPACPLSVPYPVTSRLRLVRSFRGYGCKNGDGAQDFRFPQFGADRPEVVHREHQLRTVARQARQAGQCTENDQNAVSASSDPAAGRGRCGDVRRCAACWPKLQTMAL